MDHGWPKNRLSTQQKVVPIDHLNSLELSMPGCTLNHQITSKKKRTAELRRTGAGERKVQQPNDFGRGIPTVVLEQKWEKQRAGSGRNMMVAEDAGEGIGPPACRCQGKMLINWPRQHVWQSRL